MPEPTGHGELHPTLAAVIACPACHGPLTPRSTDAAVDVLCPACALAYPVRDGVPVLLVDEAVAIGGEQPDRTS